MSRLENLSPLILKSFVVILHRQKLESGSLRLALMEEALFSLESDFITIHGLLVVGVSLHN